MLQSTVNKFAPLKKASRREKKISQKPWLTFELLNKIKTKNKLFTQLHKKFDKDNFEKYKKPRNALNCETKSAEETYYKDLIDDSKGNSSCIFLDLTKAFDTVNHDVFLQKMKKIYRFRRIAFK